jgi:GNAT superfamily N-acetyltransferase
VAWFRRKKATAKAAPRIEIRIADTRDLDDIVDMLELLVADKVPRRARTRYLKTMREEQRRMLLDPKAVWYVAERNRPEGKVLVGCARATVHEQHPLLAYLEKRDYGYMFGVFVKTEARRTGTGKRLVQKCESWLRERGAKWVFLHSTVDGIPFYEALSYEPSLEFGKHL